MRNKGLHSFLSKRSITVVCLYIRYLYHGSTNAEAAFLSAKILRHIARYPNIQARLVGDFTSDSVSNLYDLLSITVIYLFFHVMSFILRLQTVSEKLMAGFVECLDNDEAQEGVEKTDGRSEIGTPVSSSSRFDVSTLSLADSALEKRVARIRHETQIHILNLLITSLELNAPNLGLYLLGYEVKKAVSTTNLQDPGALTRCNTLGSSFLFY